MTVGADPDSSLGWRGLDTVIAAGVFIVALFVYVLSPVYQVSDSHYSMMLSENLLRHGAFALDRYLKRPLDPAKYPALAANGLPRTIQTVNGHEYFTYPPGTSILSIPFVAVLNATGISALNPDETYSIAGEVRLQRILAAVLMAGLVALVYVLCRRMLPGRWALLVAGTMAFGTQLWSTASRGMWQHTWSLVLLTGVVYLLLRAEAGKSFFPILLATLLSWSYFVRPTDGIAIAAVSAYVWFYRREAFTTLALTGGAWLSVFLVYCRITFGTFFPDFYRNQAVNSMYFDGGRFLVGIGGQLFSPARGLLVYVPVLVFTLYLLLRHWSTIRSKRLIGLGAAVFAANLLLFSVYVEWFGGHCFGARYMTDLLPWFLLASVLALAARREARAGTGSSFSGLEIAILALLLVTSVLVNGSGAVSWDTARWNGVPRDVSSQQWRLWSWRRPQFLAWLIPPPSPIDDLSLLTLAQPSYEPGDAVGRIDFTQDAVMEHLAGFWTMGSPTGRWSAGPRAVLRFSVKRTGPATLRINTGAFLVTGELDVQHVVLSLNRQPLATLTVKEAGQKVFEVAVGSSLLEADNELRFGFPDANSPMHFKLSNDERRLAVFVRWLEIQHHTDPATGPPR